MKTLMIFLIFGALAANAQLRTWNTPDPTVPKAPPSYVVVYRWWEQVEHRSGDAVNVNYEWVTRSQTFERWGDVMDWMNKGDVWYSPGHPTARLTDDELIAVYDLDKLKKVDVKFIREQKSTPKRVEIQAETWTETKWEVK